MNTEGDRKRKRKEEDYYYRKSKELANSDTKAEARYNKYISQDPYPEIESALLNSADIFRYVSKTGMIYPFYWNKLEGASYEVDIKGTVMWWDECGKMETKELVHSEDSFELKPNSIAFITLEPMFRIPDYIALRFNLKIVHVYRGLLLGTGPLVDPGFVGKLSLPLHNLTDNTYVFKAGDGIIQMEFTKLSRNKAWESKVQKSGKCFLNGDDEPVYIRKRIIAKRTVRNYIERSLGDGQNKVIRSSIPGEVKKIRDESDKAQKETIEFRKQIKEDMDELKEETGKKIQQAQWLNVAIIAAVTSVMVFACNSMYQISSSNTVKQEKITNMEKEYMSILNEHEKKEMELENRIEELEQQLEKVQFNEINRKGLNEQED